MSGDADRASRFLKHLEPLQGAMEAFCRRSVRDPNSVADVLQSTVANAFRDFDAFAPGTNFRAWIFRYLNWELLAHYRKEFRSQPSGSLAELPDRSAVDEALDERCFELLKERPEVVLDQFDETLAAAVLDLAPLERATLLLRALGEFSYREIASILEIPIGTVMSHLSRARVRVRRSLADDDRHLGLFTTKQSE